MQITIILEMQTGTNLEMQTTILETLTTLTTQTTIRIRLTTLKETTIEIWKIGIITINFLAFYNSMNSTRKKYSQ